MCGITGMFNMDGSSVDSRSLEKMTATLVHRGPDGAGFWLKGNVGFGHRRLAIRDLSDRAQQPMTDTQAHITVTYNGELYNDAELRDALAENTTFETKCDTAVIAPAYRKWGAEAFCLFNGMFAMGIWDAVNERLVLARDPVGIKPLYFSVVGRSLRFASEIKALLALDDQQRTIEPLALHRFLAQGYAGPDSTLLTGIRSLLPGSVLVANRESFWIKQYWRPKRPNDISDMGAALAMFESLWTQVIADHLVSDVPVGILLSGGIDSALVATALRGRKDVPAFTASFMRKQFDETASAHAVATACGLPHRSAMADTECGVADRFISTVYHYDGQCADSSALAFHAVCEAASLQSKVVLTGDGADEFFGGYETYRASRLASALRSILPSGLARAAAETLGSGSGGLNARMSKREKLYRWFSGIAEAPLCPHPQWRRYAYPMHLKTLYTHKMLAAVADRDPLEQYTAAVVNNPGELIDRCLLADQTYYLPGDLLVKADAMSMAHSLEVRVPFLDKRLVDFAGRLSSSLLSPLWGLDKRLLRNALKRQGVHKDIWAAPKHGFNVPVAHLLRTELRDLGEFLLNQHGGLMESYLSPDGVRTLWRQHIERRANHAYVLWSILTLATWLSDGKPKFRQSLAAA